MKPISRHRQFVKNYRRRVAPYPKLAKQFEQRLKLFTAGDRGYPLDDHPLKGSKQALRAFSVAADIRVVYRETNDCYEFLDIGSHSQVY